MVTKPNPRARPRAPAAAEEAAPCDSPSGEKLTSPQHCKSFGHLALAQFSPAECREMVTEKNSDAVTPAGQGHCLPWLCQATRDGGCSAVGSLPALCAGELSKEGAPALPTLPAPSRITTRSNSHSLPSPPPALAGDSQAGRRL